MTLLHKLIRICGALLALLLVAPALPTPGIAQAHRQRPLPLTSHLRPDGTLDRAHAQGALDPHGYTLSLAPNGAPRFAPSQAGDADWDDRFGVPGVYNGDVVASAVSAAGDLYVAGSFRRSDSSIGANHVARWDGRRWHPLGELFIGGHFQTIHRKGASTQDKSSYLAVHNVVGYTPGGDWFTIGQGGAMGVTTNGFSGFSTTVYALAAVNGGLYIGGTFNRGGGLLTPNLARWDLGSGTWSSPGTPPAERDVNVTALAGTDRMLLVGGTFTSLNDAPARSVAVLDTVTGAWDTLDGGIRWKNGTARVRAAAIRPDALFIGGQFSQAGPHPSLGFAHYNGDFGAQPLPEDGQRVYLPLIVR
jgi:hypothetical protein